MGTIVGRARASVGVVFVALAATACQPPDTTGDWSTGSTTGDLSIFGEDCSCTFYPDDDEALITCGYYAASSTERNVIAWIPTSPRYNERTVGAVWIWVDEPDEACDHYGSGVAEAWVGSEIPDPDGVSLTPYVPLHIRRFAAPAQRMCQGDGIRCFDYDNCIDWSESAAEDVRAWCKISYF